MEFKHRAIPKSHQENTSFFLLPYIYPTPQPNWVCLVDDSCDVSTLIDI